MTLQQFKASLSESQPPVGLSPLLESLWHDGNDDWDKAHDIAQDVHTNEGSLMHAYLHRKEGDNWNANYWYRRAGRTMPDVSLEQEWELMVTEFLS
jgi:hypothetical protein